MEKFQGRCHKGPLAGQILAHWSERCELLKPVIEFSLSFRDPEIITMPIGEYIFIFDQWMWRPA